MTACPWVEIIFDSPSASEAWKAIFRQLRNLTLAGMTPTELHNQTVAADRLLAESAWELWMAYQREAPRTSKALRQWWSEPTPFGRAVLILDAFSLRQLVPLLKGAQARGLLPTAVRVTGSEVPSDTDQFAGALGVLARHKLVNNGAPATFAFRDELVFTDVLRMPFEDSMASVPAVRNVFIWHTWLDDLIHVHKKSPEQIVKAASDVLQDDGFWGFVDRLRQGRKLVITADHGYAESRLFSSEETEPDVVEALRETFGASRYRVASEPWLARFMPPIVLTENDFHVVMGQRKWKVQGGFPHLIHGGLSLLEVAVPFVEFPPL
ncbi:hypothetical protein MOMUL_10560 [Moorella mulderi DSM 14980]|uniref:PglZ domain protein n=1 Tax=Moorella mulderi DSM 14980 TaxID=1122241 RepID=A0A151AXT2_9FIRM|nr:hypothetical protein MOMUL_10560 [Moorella mulderi DSM 14980]